MLEDLGLNSVQQSFTAGSDITTPGPRSSRPQILSAGIVGEARYLRDGRRQILGLRLPGDALLPGDTETLVALSAVRTSDVGRLMAALSDASPDYQPLRRAWVAVARIEQALLRDQVVRLGRMSALERVAHLLLEAHERLAQVGLATQTSFHLPLTQETVSDVVGLSVVHLNRTLQNLRRDGLVSFRHSCVTLADRERLVDLAGYASAFPAAWRPREAPSPLGALAAAS